MKKLSARKTTDGTSFHSVCITTTVNNLIATIGEPYFDDNNGTDKVNIEWEMETESGNAITIYDWKEYRPLDYDEQIGFHIGSFDKASALEAQSELLELL